MHDTVAITIQQAHQQSMLIYTHQIEIMAQAMEAEREHIALFLEHHPEMEEFLSGDVQNGYVYVPGRPEELLKDMQPDVNGFGKTCVPVEVGHGS